MEDLAWSKPPSCATKSCSRICPEPFFQVLKVTMGNNPDEVADYSIVLKQTRIKQNLERKWNRKEIYSPSALKLKEKVFGTVYNCVSGIYSIISAGKNLPREGKF